MSFDFLDYLKNEKPEREITIILPTSISRTVLEGQFF
jgi:hypothetical protein